MTRTLGSKIMFEERRVGAATLPQALVTTKLRAPRTRPNLVDRPRLREVLARTRVPPDASLRPGGLRQDHPARRLVGATRGTESP